MQKKKDEIELFKLFVKTIFKATKEPNKYDPLSPKNILAFGKLKSKNEIKIIICPIKKIENSNWLLLRLKNNKTEFIIIKFIVKRPLKPSIKFAPFIINKKHKRTKIFENILFSNHVFKKMRSTLSICMDKILISVIKKIIIKNNLMLGLILIFKSSKYPTKNKLELINIYSKRILENNR